MSLVCDIFNVSLINSVGTIYATSTLTTGDININTNSNDVRAGRGDSLISILHSGKDVSINLAEMEFKWDWLSKMLGESSATGAVDAWAMNEWHDCVDLDGEGAGTAIGVILPVTKTPKSTGSGIKVFTAAGVELASPAGYTISDNKITIVGAEVGDRINVQGYKYTTGGTAQTILINNASFPDGVICVLETLEVHEDESVLATIQYQFDECLLDGNISIQTAKERNPVAQNITLRAIKPRTSQTIGRVIRIPVST